MPEIAYNTSMPNAPKCRWFHLSPDRFMVGLILVVCFLWLSDRFRWFGFNYKGWPVLAAVAAVALCFAMSIVCWIGALVCRRRFQFSLRLLLLFFLAASIASSWLAVEEAAAKRQRAAIAAITAAGGSVTPNYGWAEWDNGFGDTLARVLTPPEWLTDLLGLDFFHSVYAVDPGTKPTADELGRLKDLGTIQCVMLPGPIAAEIDEIDNLKELSAAHRYALSWASVRRAGPGYPGLGADTVLRYISPASDVRELLASESGITDAGLKNASGLANLEVIDLSHTTITDAGIQYLRGCGRLRELRLDYTKITDAGLKYMTTFRQLRELSLACTRITDAGVASLKDLPQLETINLGLSNVTDAGLGGLRPLTQLKELDLAGTSITNAGIDQLPRLSHLETLGLADTDVSDACISSLTKLLQLRELSLESTKLTDAGIKMLRQALPSCKIDR